MFDQIYWMIGSFIISFIGIFLFNKACRKYGFALGSDINKKDQRKTPDATGIVLWISLVISLSAYFIIFGLVSRFLIWLIFVSVYALIGFFDDTKHKFTKAMPFWQKAIPIFFAVIVFSFLNTSSIEMLIISFVFIAIVSALHNTFAGLNGMESGSTIIILSATAIAVKDFIEIDLVLILLALMLALFYFNKYPAKVFAGDSALLLTGAGISAIIVSIGKIELMILVLLLHLPHLIDLFVLKLFTNSKDMSQSKTRPYKLLEDGRLSIPEYPNGKTRYDFSKLIIKIFGPLKEWQIVGIIWIIVAVNALVWLFVFSKI
ncbi:MAG: hypothetical protein Q7S21_06110 [archaeon]|nr:hypothetical protein [archaeon]